MPGRSPQIPQRQGVLVSYLTADTFCQRHVSPYDGAVVSMSLSRPCAAVSGGRPPFAGAVGFTASARTVNGMATASEMIARNSGGVSTAERLATDRLSIELLLWDVASKEERVFLERPRTQAEFARSIGKSVKWVEKEKARPEWKEARAKLAAYRHLSEDELRVVRGNMEATARQSVMSGPTGAPLTDLEKFGRLVSTMLDLAATGDREAIAFIKTQNISKQFLDQMNQDATSEFPDKSDGELVAGFVSQFEGLVVEVLRSRGFTVATPAASD